MKMHILISILNTLLHCAILLAGTAGLGVTNMSLHYDLSPLL